MRYQPQHKAETHRRLLDMAALRFRAEGLANVGIANLMADLGLTHGGFYAHFDSKQQLVAEASQQAILGLAADWQQRLAHPPAGQTASATLAASYLTRAHRDFPDSGCILAALGSELARQSKPVRQAVTAGLAQQLAVLSAANEQDRARGEANALPATAQLALMVGALLLSRLVTDEALSDRIVDDARHALRADDEASGGGSANL